MDREPLDVATLRTALLGTVAELDVVACTGSTNADLLVAARAGRPDRAVLVAERQDAGRGRRSRGWVSPVGAGLTFSVLLRPAGVPPSRLGWLPLLAGLALLRTIRTLTSLSESDTALKWPNDLLLGPGRAKCAGILAEAEPNASGGAAVVIGIGINVTTRPEELPSGATSLHTEGAPVDRTELLAALLSRLLADEADWRRAGGDPEVAGLRVDYRDACATIGSPVRVELPGGTALVATATDVDSDGRLVLRERSGATCVVAAGDVVHLRALLS